MSVELRIEGTSLKIVVGDIVYSVIQFKSLASQRLRDRVAKELKKLKAVGILPQDFNVDRFVIDEFARIFTEQYRNNSDGSSRRGEEERVFDAVVKEAALQLLRRKSLLRDVVSIFQKKIKGERENIAIVFLAFLSARTNSPFSVIVKGSSSGGKTNLVSTVAKVFREGVDYINPTIVSPAAIKYMHGASTLVLYELPRKLGEQNLIALRSIGDQLKIVGYVTVKDFDGTFRVEEVECDFKNFITTTTAVYIDDELENRLLAINVAEDPETTLQVVEHHFKSSSVSDDSFDVIRALVDFIRPCTVVRPVYCLLRGFARQSGVDLSRVPLRYRRDAKLILSIADAITCLFQYQRLKKVEGDRLYVFQEYVDYVLALRLVKEYIYKAAAKLEGRLEKLYNLIRERFGDEGFIVDDVMRYVDLSRRSVQSYLKELVDRGFLIARTDEYDRRRKRYYLSDRSPQAPCIFDFVIPDVEETERVWKELGVDSEMWGTWLERFGEFQDEGLVPYWFVDSPFGGEKRE